MGIQQICKLMIEASFPLVIKGNRRGVVQFVTHCRWIGLVFERGGRGAMASSALLSMIH